MRELVRTVEESAPDAIAGLDPRVVTAEVYHPPETAHRRVLVMRRWPRGVARQRVDEWLRDLAPSAPLLAAFRAQELAWSKFAPAYLAEIEGQQEVIDALARRAAEGGVMLLCGSHWPCHRGLLALRVHEALAP